MRGYVDILFSIMVAFAFTFMFKTRQKSFAQWQYRSQLGLSKARLLLIEKKKILAKEHMKLIFINYPECVDIFFLVICYPLSLISYQNFKNKL